MTETGQHAVAVNDVTPVPERSGGTGRQADLHAVPSVADHVVAAVSARAVSSARRARVERSWKPPKALKSGLTLGIAASVAVTVVVLWGLGGWHYYWAAQDVRAYTGLHSVLRPSGEVGRLLGVAGLSLMLLMHLYSLRKRARWMARLGSVTVWLEFHIFCGVLGPVLVTLHTSFKFNGLIAVAYWAMIVVVVSGFVGRYLYVRIPRSIMGVELGHAELAQRTRDLKDDLSTRRLPVEVLERIEAFEAAEVPASDQATSWLGLLFGSFRVRRRLASLKWAIRRTSQDRRLAREAVRLIGERIALLRRIAYLKRTKRLFDLWHVYHKPLAVVMALIVTAHVAIVWYFGYGFAGR